MSIDRRAFEYLMRIYNDQNIRALICCACARIEVDTGLKRSRIGFRSGYWLFTLPTGSLKKLFNEYLQRTLLPVWKPFITDG